MVKDGSSGAGEIHDIDSSLYGTWRNDNGTLVVTFSASGITWSGTIGSSYNNIPVDKWTVKDGKIEATYSGMTTTVWNYSIDGSGNLILASPDTPATHTLVKDKIFGDFRYEDTNSSTVTIVSYNNDGGTVNIPSSINGKPVVAIGGRSFPYYVGAFESKGLTSVTIPNSVTTIGDRAFALNQLTSVDIPNSVTSIGEDAFFNNQLTSVSIGSNVTTIGSQAFLYNQLTSVSIGSNVTTIGNSAFSDNKLTSVTIGNSVTTIGSKAFENNQLTSVTIPDSVTSIGYAAFRDNQLTSVTIGPNVTIDDLLAFNDDMYISSGFETAYNSNNKAAGTYTRTSTSVTTWTKQ